MERTQRVAKLEALLARVQSRSYRAGGGETHGNAAVAIAQPAQRAVQFAPVAAAPVARAPVAAPVQAPPPQAATPKPAPVAASAPPAEPARAPIAAHEMQEEVATVVRDVPVEALAAIAAASAQQNAIASHAPAAGAPPPAAAPPPAVAAAPPAAAAPAVAGRSAFGGLSKKMTLIGTAPPANWPPRGAEASVPPPEPAVAKAPSHHPPPEAQEDAPAIEATESEGDLDALLGDEASAPPAAIERHVAAPLASVASHAVTQASTAIATPKATLPIVAPPPKSRSATTVIAMIALWLMLIAVIWFVYKSSM